MRTGREPATTSAVMNGLFACDLTNNEAVALRFRTLGVAAMLEPNKALQKVH